MSGPDKIKAEIAALQRLAKTDDGVMVLAWLASFCREDERTWVQGSFDGTAFKEGSRAVILEIRRRIRVDLGAQPAERTAKNKERSDG